MPREKNAQKNTFLKISFKKVLTLESFFVIIKLRKPEVKLHKACERP